MKKVSKYMAAKQRLENEIDNWVVRSANQNEEIEMLKARNGNFVIMLAKSAEREFALKVDLDSERAKGTLLLLLLAKTNGLGPQAGA